MRISKHILPFFDPSRAIERVEVDEVVYELPIVEQLKSRRRMEYSSVDNDSLRDRGYLNSTETKRQISHLSESQRMLIQRDAYFIRLVRERRGSLRYHKNFHS